ncbi:MAG: hypothetical protein JJU28_09245 [Cyclobacteriaceae bacterium]|nr:hypothetical protein [Cyclobacteriaceae bacterium]
MYGSIFLRLVLLILVGLPGISFLHAQNSRYEWVPVAADSTDIIFYSEAFDTKIVPSGKSTLYLGSRLGGVFVAGVNLTYIYFYNNRPVLFLEGALQTTLIINSVNGAAGIYLGQNVSAGVRYHRIYRYIFEDEYNGFAWAPELAWTKFMGVHRRKSVQLRAGLVIERAIYPDISFGINIPIHRGP